jgi:putative N6-adenine-specific DNA methylase
VSRVETQVITTPGIEALTAAELSKMGVRVARTGRGGLSCEMTFSQLALAHLQLRTATRVLVRLRRFKAERFEHVTNGVAAIPWAEYLTPGQPVQVRATASGSRLFHTGGIAEAVYEGLPDGSGEGLAADDDTPPGVAAELGAAIVSVRVSHDVATVSIDASGLPLYRRGYRTHIGDAPLRESLAAALVMWSGWTGKTPLLDPCCGSGTIAIEAAMWARRIAPGAGRTFAFEQWPTADAAAVERVRAGVAADVLPRVKASIVASDTDRHALAAARSNAERAGVTDDIVFESVDVRTREPGTSFVITNPPYGVRLSADLPAVYSGLARAGSPLAVILPSGAKTGWMGRPVTDTLPTTNGGLDVTFTSTFTPTAPSATPSPAP